MKKSTFAVSALAVIILAAASSVAMVQFDHGDHNLTHTAWKDVYVEPEAMVRGVDAVVVARHIGTSPGRVALSSDPSDAVPFELNHFIVERGFKGLQAGDSFTLERVGGVLNGDTILLDADGGPYVPGQEYALFVNRQPESEFYYLVNDEGRYAIDAERRLVPVRHDGAVSQRLAGLDVNAFGRNVREAVSRVR